MGDLPREPWVLIAGNPFSGVGKNALRAQHLADALAAAGLKPRLVWDRADRQAILTHPELTRHCRCVVAAGGDGTLGDVINICPDLPVAVLPLGTENLLAKHFGFTSPPEVVAQAIARGQTRRIDLGLVWSSDAPGGATYPGGAGVKARKFTLMASAGIDAQVAHRLARWRAADGKMRRVRHTSYFRPILDTVRDYPYPTIDIQSLDGRRTAGSNVMVFNLPCYGFNLGFGHSAVADDGKLDYRVFTGAGFMRTSSFIVSSVRRKQLRRADAVQGLTPALDLTGATPVPLQIDGDAAGYTPARIEILPHALSLIAVEVAKAG
ncbi:MAG: diacylglycerol kinase family protein [Planctomycetota bacterium]|nr:diacylglycerol kinase family protein [Planctomycetota bacterium]